MTVMTYIQNHWLSTSLIICSAAAIYYVYKNRHKLLQTKTYNRRTKP